MIVLDLTPLEVTLLAAGFGSLLALAVLWIVRGRLRAEIAAVGRRAYPADVAYQRFTASSASLAHWFITLVLAVAIIGLVANVQFPDSGEQSGAFPWTAVFGLLPSLLLPFVVYNLVSVPLVSLPALRQLRALRVGAGEILALRMKQSAIAFFPLLILGLAGVVVPAEAPLIVSLLAATAVCVVLLALFGAHVLRWQVRTTPLEQTEWAALAPRVAAWQRAIGVRLRDVRVQHTGRLGYANVQVAGTLDRTLFLSDAFLATSDWRQRDALVAWAIGYTRRAPARAGRRLALYAFLALLVAATVALPQLATGLDPLLLSVLPFIFLVPVLIVLAARPRRRVRDMVTATDRFAAELTGDPLAVIVALTTLNNVNAGDPQRAARRYPSLAGRVTALAALLAQPGARAPFAVQPVPSAVPVALDGRPVTVPLDQSPPAAPVPAAQRSQPAAMAASVSAR